MESERESMKLNQERCKLETKGDGQSRGEEAKEMLTSKGATTL